MIDETGNREKVTGDSLQDVSYLEVPAGSGYIIVTSTTLGNNEGHPVTILPPAKFCKGKEITISYCCAPRGQNYTDTLYIGSYMSSDMCWNFQSDGTSGNLNNYVKVDPGEVVKLVSTGAMWVAIAKFGTYLNYNVS